MEMREGYCPKCGNALSIPSHLADFSCLYCGARLTPNELMTQEAICTGASDEDYTLFETSALHAMVDYPQSLENMSKPLFFPYYERYRSECRAPFEALQRWVMGNDGKGAEQAALKLMEQLEDWFQKQKGWKLPGRRSEIRDRVKFTIAIFMVPMIHQCAPVIANTFCTTLRNRWIELYPQSTFELVTYEELSEGFSKRRFCFITTAVCESRGLPDDCPMLTEFRHFRDGYLRATEDGPALIQEYYDTAPGIVIRIDYCENREAIYERLYNDYLLPCLQSLHNNDPAACRDRYVTMMRQLQAGTLYS